MEDLTTLTDAELFERLDERINSTETHPFTSYEGTVAPTGWPRATASAGQRRSAPGLDLAPHFDQQLDDQRQRGGVNGRRGSDQALDLVELLVNLFARHGFGSFSIVTLVPPCITAIQTPASEEYTASGNRTRHQWGIG